MTKGINPKSWFYGLRKTIADKNNRMVLAGAACEQWINGELFQIIARGLAGTELTAYPEWHGRQHDIAIWKYQDGDVTAEKNPVAVVESKVVYPNYSIGKRKNYIDRLFEQVSVDHKCAPAAVGFLIGIYADWQKPKKQKETFGEFRRSIGSLLREGTTAGVAGFSVSCRPGGPMETFLDKTTINVGAAEVVVGCVGQYFTLTRKPG